jgi:hypothetical protein
VERTFRLVIDSTVTKGAAAHLLRGASTGGVSLPAAVEPEWGDGGGSDGRRPEFVAGTGAVLEAIAELPESRPEPIVLFAQGELSYEEIAAQLQLPIATVKIRIFGARQKLEKFR